MESKSIITENDLEDFRNQLIEEFKPVKENFEIIKKQYLLDEELSNSKFIAKLDEYYDQQLLDKTDVPVRIGNYLEKEGKYFIVTNRGMQIIFGTMLFNNRLGLKKLDKDFLQKPKAKEYSISKEELKEYISFIPGLINNSK